jgi:hypothetical protein
MKTQWFKRLGWFYVPASLLGIIITLAALAPHKKQIFSLAVSKGMYYV